MKRIAAALGAGAMMFVLAIPALAQAGSGDQGSSASSSNPCDEHFFAGQGRENCAAVMGGGSASSGSGAAGSLSVSSTNHCDEQFTGKGREDCLAVKRRDEAQRTTPESRSVSSGSSSAGVSSTAGSNR